MTGTWRWAVRLQLRTMQLHRPNHWQLYSFIFRSELLVTTGADAGQGTHTHGRATSFLPVQTGCEG